ncbi:hypothetical protein MYBA111488_24525 [Mycobacterium basiliense]
MDLEVTKFFRYVPWRRNLSEYFLTSLPECGQALKRWSVLIAALRQRLVRASAIDPFSTYRWPVPSDFARARARIPRRYDSSSV